MSEAGSPRYRTLWALILITGLALPLLTLRTAKPGECYPFSNFPMYSSFDPETYYVYVTDLKDQPVRVTQLFGPPLSSVRKMYDTQLIHLKKETKAKEPRARLPLVYKQEAAGEVLALLIKNSPPAQRPAISVLSGLRLHQVDIRLKEGRIVKQTEAVGEMVLNTAAR
jgi:hypothetical protein